MVLLKLLTLQLIVIRKLVPPAIQFVQIVVIVVVVAMPPIVVVVVVHHRRIVELVTPVDAYVVVVVWELRLAVLRLLLLLLLMHVRWRSRHVRNGKVGWRV